MMRRHTSLLALAVAPMLSGCVVAALPAAAAAGIGARTIDRDHGDRRVAANPDSDSVAHKQVAAPAPTPVPTPTVASDADVPPEMQYLFGSGEAAALDMQAYLMLGNFLLARSSDRDIGHEVASVVLTPGSTLRDASFVPCGNKPLAVVFDIDETVIYNLGFEADAVGRSSGYDAERWDRWEKTGGADVEVVPGAHDMIALARRAGIAVVFNSNRSAANAGATARMLADAGLGPAEHGETLFLKGDSGGESGKDGRRAAIAEKYCVIAMVGDQLGDFSDLFNSRGQMLDTRRAAVRGRGIGTLWGNGWFVLPNPVYGSGLKGDMDAVFPAAKRWRDPDDAAAR